MINAFIYSFFFLCDKMSMKIVMVLERRDCTISSYGVLKLTRMLGNHVLRSMEARKRLMIVTMVISLKR